MTEPGGDDACWLDRVCDDCGAIVEAGTPHICRTPARDPVVLRDVEGGAGAVCDAILQVLPEWFGIPEANAHYVETAETHPGVVASVGAADVGITTLEQHSEHAAEVYLMAVAPSHHRQGIGTAMLRHVEARLAAMGVEFLQVKTLSERQPDAGYDKTRRFWLASGFRRLEEFPTLWGPDNPALQLVKSLTCDTPRSPNATEVWR